MLPSVARKRLNDFLVKKRRPWTTDDFFAVGTWLFVGNGLFLLIGTTSFVSIALVFAKSLQVQETLFSKLAQHLTNTTGFKVSFDAPIVPNWRKGLITLNDVSMQNHPLSDENVSLYDLKISKIEIELSLLHFLEGKGWIKSLNARGIRGTIDKRALRPSGKKEKYSSQPGDFHIKDVTVKDVLLTVYYPNFRPFSLSVISAEFSKLRKQWLLLDVISATNIIGMYDGCLFSIHTPQLTTEDRKTLELDNMRHFKIDGLPIDQINSKTSGPLSWITRGRVDFNVLFQLPSKEKKSMNFDRLKESLILALIKQVEVPDSMNQQLEVDNYFSRHVRSLKEKIILPILHSINDRGGEGIPIPMKSASVEKDRRMMAKNFASAPENVLSFKVDLKLGDLHANIPLSNPDLSITNHAIIRPLVGYINEHKPFIPISVFFKIGLDDFEGAFSLSDSGIIQALSINAADSFIQLMNDEKQRMRRFSKVGLWTIQSLIKNLAYAFEPFNNDFAAINI